MARSGQGALGAAEAPASAIRSALHYVQQYNAHALLAGAQAAAAEAWVQLTEVAFTKQYEQLGSALPGTSPAEKLLEVLMACLEVCACRESVPVLHTNCALGSPGSAGLCDAMLTCHMTGCCSLARPAANRSPSLPLLLRQHSMRHA